MSRAYATAVGYPLDGLYQAVSFTATSAATSNAVSAQTYRVVLFATEHCHIRFGASPTAVTTDFFLAKDNMVVFPVRPGQKIAAIRSSADGTLHVSEIDSA